MWIGCWKISKEKADERKENDKFGLTTTASLNIFLDRLSRREYFFRRENLILYKTLLTSLTFVFAPSGLYRYTN